MASLLIKQLRPLFFVLTILAMYIFMAPVSVQSGDTGELVTNSYFLRVSHPPGYPLWTLLYHLPVKYLNFGNHFQAASIFTAFIATVAFACLGLSFNSRANWFCLAVISTTTIIWKMALLPDVFSLHLLFLSLVFISFARPEMLNRWWMILLVALSVAHHHTIVFVFPMFLFALFESRINQKKILICLVSGLFSLSLYFLLMTFHPDDYGSWGSIHSISDVLHHFLRRDYGTLNLMTDKGEGISWISFFLQHSLMDMWSLWIVIGYFFIKERELLKRKGPKLLILFSCIILYFIVFGMQTVSLSGESEAVIERFLLQPLLLLAFAAIYLISESRKELPKVLLLLLLINGGLNVGRNFSYLNFSNKTGIENLIKNSLKDVPSGSVIYTRGDSFSFGTYYLINVAKFRPDIRQIHANWDFQWSQEKARAAYPDIFKTNDRNLPIVELINLDRVPFYTNFSTGLLPSDVGISYQGILYRYYSKAMQEHPLFKCDQEYILKNRLDMAEFTRFETNAYFDQTYGSCDFASGLYELKSGNPDAALVSFRRAVELSPFNARFQERLCFVLQEKRHPETHLCQQRLDQLILNTSEQYYLNKYTL